MSEAVKRERRRKELLCYARDARYARPAHSPLNLNPRDAFGVNLINNYHDKVCHAHSLDVEDPEDGDQKDCLSGSLLVRETGCG